MKQDSRPRPVVLCILDGWGEREEAADNAIAQADKPVWDRLTSTRPHARIDASGGDVGLPTGQMGNSEVGHMNIGAGRVVVQDLPRVDRALADGSLAANDVLASFVQSLRDSGGTAHLMGLVSPGGVHSHQRHIAALANILAEQGVPVAVHAFLDGRDTPPSSARDFLADFLEDAPRAKIATVSGRYYAMDRDRRWDRVEKAYRALVDARGEAAEDVLAAVDSSYADGRTDEFMLPTVIGDYPGMADGDGVLMANFRSDRVREILLALLDPEFEGFARERRVAFAAAVGMAEYSTRLAEFMRPLFPPLSLEHVLG
ncbi:MAG TPA: phosphoglycerate mutase (2,3-diphosphoglycerate-independent), partial [Halothiobacillaceae bacterium]|nr:phosphoglycerate mutase (2,3-diphosphoglycerate-independent) [Halothiobacillaceae bacterium]